MLTDSIFSSKYILRLVPGIGRYHYPEQATKLMQAEMACILFSGDFVYSFDEFKVLDEVVSLKSWRSGDNRLLPNPRTSESVRLEICDLADYMKQSQYLALCRWEESHPPHHGSENSH
jgi:hypothetical protein